MPSGTKLVVVCTTTGVYYVKRDDKVGHIALPYYRRNPAASAATFFHVCTLSASKLFLLLPPLDQVEQD
jgi:hypothetical protein